jgi:hypothetical protein
MDYRAVEETRHRNICIINHALVEEMNELERGLKLFGLRCRQSPQRVVSLRSGQLDLFASRTANRSAPTCVLLPPQQLMLASAEQQWGR